MKNIIKSLLSVVSPFISWILICLFLKSDNELVNEIGNAHLYIYTGFLLVMYISLIYNISLLFNCIVEKIYGNEIGD